MSDREFIALRIRGWAMYQNRTYRDLAEYVGVSASTVGNWCRGRCAIPADKLVQLARLLEVPLEEFDQQASADPS